MVQMHFCVQFMHFSLELSRMVILNVQRTVVKSTMGGVGLVSIVTGILRRKFKNGRASCDPTFGGQGLYDHRITTLGGHGSSREEFSSRWPGAFEKVRRGSFSSTFHRNQWWATIPLYRWAGRPGGGRSTSSAGLDVRIERFWYCSRSLLPSNFLLRPRHQHSMKACVGLGDDFGTLWRGRPDRFWLYQKSGERISGLPQKRSTVWKLDDQSRLVNM